MQNLGICEFVNYKCDIHEENACIVIRKHLPRLDSYKTRSRNLPFASVYMVDYYVHERLNKSS